ncbi:hypothetical protein [Verrucosispora sp. TAA-831]|uniref:hypothetical protein n=1 Tax=Verrucosispora sp. TAA-831 TaxID=3422227 RepID=UPI003D6ED976
MREFLLRRLRTALRLWLEGLGRLPAVTAPGTQRPAVDPPRVPVGHPERIPAAPSARTVEERVLWEDLLT